MIRVVQPLGTDAAARRRLVGRAQVMKSAELRLAGREQRVTMMVTQLWGKELRKKLLVGMADREEPAASPAPRLRSLSPRLGRLATDPDSTDAFHMRSVSDLRLQPPARGGLGSPRRPPASPTTAAEPPRQPRARPPAVRVLQAERPGPKAGRLFPMKQPKEQMASSRPPQTIFSPSSYGIATGDYERCRLRRMLSSYRIVCRK